MSKWLIGSLWVGLAAVFALRGDAQPPQSEKEWSADTFRIVKHVADLPDAVKKQFPNPSMRNEFRMAEPGKPFRATDVGSGDRPTRRLVFAGLSHDYGFIHYEHGGRGYSCGVAVFRLTGKEARFIGGIILWKPARDLQALRKAIQNKPLAKDTGGF